jgi:hypothetical protein
LCLLLLLLLLLPLQGQQHLAQLSQQLIPGGIHGLQQLEHHPDTCCNLSALLRRQLQRRDHRLQLGPGGRARQLCCPVDTAIGDGRVKHLATYDHSPAVQHPLCQLLQCSLRGGP